MLKDGRRLFVKNTTLSKVLVVMCDFHSELGFNRSEASIYFKDNKKIYFNVDSCTAERMRVKESLEWWI